ncbi:hypothetical protein K8I31_15970 [bacterium]|nr:hypothetical protein [bacterium]
MNSLKEIALFTAFALVIGTIVFIKSSFQPPLHTAEPWVLAEISRTNIVSIKGPSQVFFSTPDGSFVLYDWVKDDFFAPKPYKEPFETPKTDEVLKILNNRLAGDVAVNIAYSEFALNWFLDELDHRGNSSKAMIEDPRRKIRAFVTWNDGGSIREYYEESFDKRPRLSIVYYSNGNPRKIKHFNALGRINGGAYEFYPNGRLQTYSHFFEGEPWGPYCSWDEEGRLIKEDFMTGMNHKKAKRA